MPCIRTRLYVKVRACAVLFLGAEAVPNVDVEKKGSGVTVEVLGVFTSF